MLALEQSAKIDLLAPGGSSDPFDPPLATGLPADIPHAVWSDRIGT